LLKRYINQGRSTPGAALQNDVAVKWPLDDAPGKNRKAIP
jgi:hypothetical protein